MYRYILILFFIATGSGSLAQEIRSDSLIKHYLEKEYHIHFSRTNSLVIFNRGADKFRDLFQAIRDAKKTIHLEYFNFRNDSISNALFKLLEQKAKQHVKVRALFDGFGNSSNNKPLYSRKLKKLRKKGIEIYEFDPIRFPYFNHILHRDHRKIVVIDGTIAYTGGMNVADYYIKGKKSLGDWRDIHTRVKGPVVKDLQRIFLNFWNKVTRQRIHDKDLYTPYGNPDLYFGNLPKDTTETSGNKEIGVVNRDPYISPKIIHDTFVQAIDDARKNIEIINPYFTLCPHIRRALKRAVKRGVNVEIMVSAKSDIPITPRVVEHNAHRLMETGANIYFFEGGFHHSKIMMVDSLFSFVGSANLNSRSLSFDYECNLMILDKHTTMELMNIFNADKNTRCWKLTPQTWKTNFSKFRRFKDWFFQFLSPFV